MPALVAYDASNTTPARCAHGSENPYYNIRLREKYTAALEHLEQKEPRRGQGAPGLRVNHTCHVFLLRTRSVSHMGGAMLPTNHFVSGRLGMG